MKKTRGKKRKVSSHSISHKKLAQPVSLLKKYIPLLILIAILLAVAVILNAVTTGNAITGNVVRTLVSGAVCGSGNFESTPISCGNNLCADLLINCPSSGLVPATTTTPVATAGEDILAGNVPNPFEIVINFFNTGAPTDAIKIGSTWKDLIIAVIVFTIILAGMYSILTLTSIFDSVWVIWVITVGLSIIATLTGIVRNLTAFMIQFAAGLGAFGIVLEIIIAIAIFIGLSIGNTWMAKWAAKRKGQKEHIKAITGANEAGAAIVALKQLQKDFKAK